MLEDLLCYFRIYGLLFLKNATKIRLIIYLFEVIYHVAFSKVCLMGLKQNSLSNTFECN